MDARYKTKETVAKSLGIVRLLIHILFDTKRKPC